MSFNGSEFIFDGISSREFDLVLYSQMANASQEQTAFASNIKVLEDRPMRKYTSYCYGGSYEDSLQFTLVLGVSEERKSSGRDFDRWEMQRISSWLTGHRQYKWLQIVQDDLTNVRYHCMISNLTSIEISGYCWGYQCRVTCDSPFAQLLPETYHYDFSGSLQILFRNKASINDPYYPKMRLSIQSGDSFSIVNHSDGDREFSLKGIPLTSGQIDVDHELQIIQCSGGLNLYPHWNKKFLRLKPGDNSMTISGTGSVDFTCSFPVNVGG